MKRGKNWFIRGLAAEILHKRICDVTEAQYLVAKKLFLAIAYDATEEVREKFRNELMSC